MNRTARRASPWLLASVLVPLALLASACLPAGVRVPQDELSGLLERKAGLIAYLSTDGNIYTIDQGGQRKTPITHNAYISDTTFLFYGLPNWSPDSQSLAFVSYAGTRGQIASSEMRPGRHCGGLDNADVSFASASVPFSVNSRTWKFVTAASWQRIISRNSSNSGLRAP